MHLLPDRTTPSALTRTLRTAASAIFGLLLLHSSALAVPLDQVTDCAELSAEDRTRVEGLMASQYLYDCCEDTVSVCLAEPEPCPLARRLTGELCRRVKAKQDDAAITTALDLRARSMMPAGPLAELELTGVPSRGPEDAPVVLVMYACARCPFCAQMNQELEEHFVEGGDLADKVRWVFKVFPLKNHPGSVEAGLGAIAAHEQGGFWPYMALVFERFDHFNVDALPMWTAELGLDPVAYQTAVEAPATREQLVQWKREGIANGVKGTPTLFINGRLYQGELRVPQVVDVLLEEHERLSARE